MISYLTRMNCQTLLPLAFQRKLELLQALDLDCRRVVVLLASIFFTIILAGQDAGLGHDLWYKSSSFTSPGFISVVSISAVQAGALLCGEYVSHLTSYSDGQVCIGLSVGFHLAIILSNSFILGKLLPAHALAYWICAQQLNLMYSLSIIVYKSVYNEPGLRTEIMLNIQLVLYIVYTALGFFYALETDGVETGSSTSILRVSMSILFFVMYACALGGVVRVLNKLYHHFRSTGPDRQLGRTDTCYSGAVAITASLLAVVSLVFPMTCEGVIVEDPPYLPIDRPSDSTKLLLFVVLAQFAFLILGQYQDKKAIIGAKESLIRQKKLTAAISHEIRTPLNTAFIGLELLKDELKHPEPGQTDEQLRTGWISNVRTIRQACDIALDIVNELLTFDKLRVGMLQLERKLISAKTLLTKTTKLFKIQAIQRNITFVTRISDPAGFKSVKIFADEYKINQVLRNFLSNAMKFTPQEGMVTITVDTEIIIGKARRLLGFRSSRQNSANGKGSSSESGGSGGDSGWGGSGGRGRRRPSGDSVASEQENCGTNDIRSKAPVVAGAKCVGLIRIAITDSGAGISKEDQQKLFQEYVQISPGALQKGQGSGLGLSIAKAIVKMHGGSIGLHSDGEGCGSTFFFELPVYHYTESDTSTGKRGRRDSDTNQAGADKSSLHSESFSADYSVLSLGTNKSPAPGIALAAGIGASSLHNHELRPATSPSTPAGPAAACPLHQQHTMQLCSTRNMNGLGAHAAVVPAQSLQDHIARSLIAASSAAQQEMGGAGERAGVDQNPPIQEPDGPVEERIYQAIAPLANLSSAGDLSGTKGGINNPSQSSVAAAAGGKIESKLHVLIADDSPPNRKMLSRLLTREGHTCMEVEDGTDAVEAIREMIMVRLASESLTKHNGQSASLQGASLSSSSHHRFLSPGSSNADGAVKEVQVGDDSSVTIAAVNCQSSHPVSDKHHGHRHHHPSHGAEALAAHAAPALSNHFDLVLLDNYMLRMNGPEAVRAIRALGYTGAVFGVSGIAGDEVDEFLAAGADCVLGKPLKIRALYAALRDLHYS